MVAVTTGERYDFKHKPLVKDTDIFSPRCSFVLPSGKKCDRLVNFVRDNFHPIMAPEFMPEGHWRHNPRPYSNY